MKRYAFTLISALLVSLALPVGVAHADAATVSVNAGVISFTAPVDRGVDLRVWVDALGRYAFKDSAGQLAGGEGCIAINAQKVVCDAAADFLEVDGSPSGGRPGRRVGRRRRHLPPDRGGQGGGRRRSEEGRGGRGGRRGGGRERGGGARGENVGEKGDKQRGEKRKSTRLNPNHNK